MSTNVFGNPVTDTTVKLLYPNLSQITARHRAEVAIEYRNANGRAHQVSEFVHTLRRSVSSSYATLCMIYNATGNNLTLFRRNAWGGNVTRQFYPYLVQNGQWIGFLHTNLYRETVGIGGSCEGFVYSGKDNDGQVRYWIQCWQNTFRSSRNHVYTEIHSAGSWNQSWNNIYSEMGKQGNVHSSTARGCYSNVTIVSGNSPEFVGLMTLSGITTKFMDMASDVSTIFPSLDFKYDDDDDDDDDDGVAEDDDATPPLPEAAE